MNRDRASDNFESYHGPLKEDDYIAVAEKYGLPLDDPAIAEIAPYYVFDNDTKYIASALLKAREKLIEQRTNAKTGALEDWAFREELERAVKLREAASQYGAHSGLVLVTIDAENFGEVNRRHGHPTGDKVLRGIVDFAKTIARINDGDLVGRIGGDEFAILLNFDESVISKDDFIRLLDERMLQYPLDKNPNLSGVKWNHAFLEADMTTEDLFSSSDVKGDQKKAFVRAHSKTTQENKQALELALSKSLPLLQ